MLEKACGCVNGGVRNGGGRGSDGEVEVLFNVLITHGETGKSDWGTAVQKSGIDVVRGSDFDREQKSG